jgi:branched-chain amino acid aminotransferase
MGYDVREEKVDVDYAMNADECFCAGTAAVISSIGSIEHGDRVASFGEGEVGPITRVLYDELTGIQQRRIPDERGWTVTID